MGGETLVELGETVVLDGSESTLGAHTEGLDLGLSYFWRLDSSPAGSGLIDEDLLDPEEVQGDDDDCAEVDVDIPSGAEEGAVVVLTPDIQGLFGVTLQVSDGERLSAIAPVVPSDSSAPCTVAASSNVFSMP